MHAVRVGVECANDDGEEETEACVLALPETEIVELALPLASIVLDADRDIVITG